MKTEDLILKVAMKVQEKYQMEMLALNNRHDVKWQEMHQVQERLRTSMMMVQIIKDVIAESIGEVE